MIFALALAPSAAFAWGGAGTAGDPYQISDAEDLIKFRDIVNGTGDETKDTDAYAKLMGDILNLSSVEENWTPIGNSSTNHYTGTFDGGEHKITNLQIEGYASTGAGLFGNIGSGGKVMKLTVENVSITSTKGDVGGIAGYNGGTIENCFNTVTEDGTGTISGTGNVGGIAGRNSGGTVTGCENSSDVTGRYNFTGGIVGYNSGGSVEQCLNSGNVSGGGSVGGIAGISSGTSGSSSVTECENSGAIEGSSDNIGGIVGSNAKGNVETCNNSGNVVGANLSKNVGGVVGGNTQSGDVIDCTNTADVTGSDYVGGIVGKNGRYNKDAGSVSNSSNAGTVTGGENSTHVGDIVGQSANSSSTTINGLNASIDSSTIKTGDTTTIRFTTSPGQPADAFDPANGAIRSGGVSAEYSQPGIAEAAYNDDGTVTVTGLAEGETDITLTVAFYKTDAETPENLTFTYHVTVSDIQLNGLSFTETGPIEMTEGTKRTLTVNFDPSNVTDKSIDWSSSNEAVATAKELGTGTAIVTAVAEGTAEITATSPSGVSEKIIVNVIKADTTDDNVDGPAVTPKDPVPQHSGGGGGGCSAGWSVMALLALAPMILRRKK